MSYKCQNLLLRHAAHFHALAAAMMTAEDSNSRLRRFQKLRQVLAKRFIRSILYRWRPQAHLQRSTHHTRNLVFARARLHPYGKNHRSFSCL
jgi:hypothetical protein